MPFISFNLGDEKVKPWLENAIYFGFFCFEIAAAAFLFYQFIVRGI